MKLLQILEPLENIQITENPEIADIVYDSRKVLPGTLFVCLRGHTVDGHKYAKSAVEKGAAAIVAEEPLEVEVPVIVVENTRQALAQMSAAFFGYPAETDIKVIGITGTKGKTTTAHMIQSILESAGHKTGVIGTIGIAFGDTHVKTENTTPESYEVQRYLRKMADAGCAYCVMEASSIGLKDYRVFGFSFEIGVFTNFSEDHVGGLEHPDMQDYLESKRRLFRMCKTGIVNIDDANWQPMLAGHTCKVKTYGFLPQAQMRGENYRLLTRPGFLGIAFAVCGDLEFTAEVGVPGKFNCYNALAAIAGCHVLGISPEDINRGLRNVRVKGRMEPVSVPGNYTLLIDYAHNAVSMESLLTTLREYRPARLVCLFGAGGNRPKARRYEMGKVSGNLADLSVITADNSRDEDVLDILADIKTGLAQTTGRFVEVPDRKAAIRFCIETAQDGDIIVLAGKGHEDYQEIKGVKHHLDEREVVAAILRERKESRCKKGDL